jgi:hypothetical protein
MVPVVPWLAQTTAVLTPDHPKTGNPYFILARLTSA